MSDPQPIGSLTGTPIPPINASYTALIATLVVLLAVASVIVGRSFILRRRHRRLLDDPIREGGVTAGGSGGGGDRLWTLGNDIGPEVRRGAVREKPGVWQAWIQNIGVMGKDGGRVALADIKVGFLSEPCQRGIHRFEKGGDATPAPRVTTATAFSVMWSTENPQQTLRVFVLVAMPTPESSSFFSPLPTDRDEDIDGLPRRVGGLPPIEMGAVEAVFRGFEVAYGGIPNASSVQVLRPATLRCCKQATSLENSQLLPYLQLNYPDIVPDAGVLPLQTDSGFQSISPQTATWSGVSQLIGNTNSL
ncbi:hypothetical protein PISMIDRAFT_22746 [Pisolithus microcarpus 441]|uniref:Uncharacterized protein n=1 Tax=Pisolithus microcarpus 441 TaxID=765257 RepID=A0A0C9ZUJ8_9AGAM|nr:hypothetical protein PISMIDRAFT_22746 [Pisolithus microcarpus 441]